MADPNLNFSELTAGQTNKETTVNTALARISAAMNEVLVVSLSAGNVNLTNTQQATAIRIRAQGHTVARNLGLNTNVGSGANTAQRLLFISNEGTAAITVTDADSGGGTTIVIPAGVTAVVQVDKTNINLVMSNGNASAVADWKESVRAATVAAGTLATSFENGDTIDGVVLATGDRILVKNQAAGAENGVYTVNATGAPTRATDFVNPKVSGGTAVYVEAGTANADTLWTVTNDGVVDVGTTAITFAAVGGGANNVTAAAVIADNAIVRGDGGARGVQGGSGVTIDDSGNLNNGATFNVDILIADSVTNPFVRADEGATNTDYIELKHISAAQGQLRCPRTTGQALIDLQAEPLDGTSNALFRFFRETNTSGLRRVDMHKGDGTGTVTHRISCGGALSFMTADASNMGFAGQTSPVCGVDSATPIRPGTYTVATVPTASAMPGAMIYVSDETGGATIAFSDGTNWRRVQDRAVVA